MIRQDDSDEIADVAGALADAAAAITLRYFRTAAFGVASKRADFDPVTEADREAEAAMRAILSERRPDDAVLGEEFGPSEGRPGAPEWVLDPIDGTRAFISGAPTWGTLVALRREGVPVFGLIDQPFTGERFVGGLGRAELTGRAGRSPLRTRATRHLGEAILYSTFPEIGTAGERDAFGRVARGVKLTRYGFDCYAYALLALGTIDLVIEAGLEPYDVAAPIAVIEAAGGVVTAWDGGPAGAGGRILAAATPALHAAARAALAG